MPLKILALSLFWLVVAVAPAPAERVDLLVTGGTVVTMDAERRVHECGFVAVKDGRIVAVGPGPGNIAAEQVLDATGKAVVPGLINAHTHLPMVLFRGLADDRVLKEWLHEVIFPAEAANVDRHFVSVGTRLGLAELIRGGVTTFADMYYFEDAIAEETRKAGLKAVLGQTVLDFPAPDHKTWPAMLQAVRRFHQHWGNDPLVTPAIAPHAPYTVSAEHWKDVSSLAEELDIPILTHLAEAPLEVEHTLANYGQRPVGFLDSLGLLSSRLLGAHAIYLEPSEIALLAERGVGVSHCPESNMKVAVGVSPVPDLLKSGVRVGLGTDGAASNNDLDMWQEMDSAAKLHKCHRQDPTVLPAPQAFWLATVGGAQALHKEREIGSLEVGKAADMALIDLEQVQFLPRYDIYSLLVYAAKARDVSHTIVNGRLLMRDRKLLTIDEDILRSEVLTLRQRILDSLPAR
jgi:5-methylthioadenosine/S-adenosylhomocysteine deaminase